MIVQDEKGEDIWIPRIAETYEEAWEDLMICGMYVIRTD